MDSTTQDSLGRDFLADCERIHREWDTHAKSRDTDSLISLYAQDAILETPLVPAIFEGRSGVPPGHREIRPFFPLCLMVRHVNYRSFRERLRGLRRLDQDTAQEIERRIVCDPKQPSVEIAIDTAPVMRAQ